MCVCVCVVSGHLGTLMFVVELGSIKVFRRICVLTTVVFGYGDNLWLTLKKKQNMWLSDYFSVFLAENHIFCTKTSITIV